MPNILFASQFNLDAADYIKNIDLQNWHRYYVVIKTVQEVGAKKVLEVGIGNEIIKYCLLTLSINYKSIDINAKLNPNIVCDIREFQPQITESFDCVICTEVLEHMPFNDLSLNLTNIYNYLTPGGSAIITVPHREARIMVVSPFSHYTARFISLPYLHTPRGYWNVLINHLKRKVDLDPHHCWEIGRAGITIPKLEKEMTKTGFRIEKFRKLLYVDFWLLKKCR